MQVIDVTATLGSINFAPASELAEILQNVRTILNTAKGTVPLDRDFGIDTSILDVPIPATKEKITANIIETVEKYEPRVKVTGVSFDGDAESGIITPTVKVAITS
ncbi:GPW/gp25 family protein [Pectinatus frisingensis]|uniref:GPW/gp25 family protein n=1 Tax=Pectinatus frisingensis TaxID=865 RepID=UPI0018C585E5|nr:GPW/gp25 family protein [Pectinatus frisingensis]